MVSHCAQTDSTRPSGAPFHAYPRIYIFILHIEAHSHSQAPPFTPDCHRRESHPASLTARNPISNLATFSLFFGRCHRASHVRARGWHLSHSDRTHLSFLFFLFLRGCRNNAWGNGHCGLRSSPLLAPSDRQVHLRPAQLGLSFGLFNYARGRRHGRRHPLPARRFFPPSARAFGPQKNRKCKKCGIFGVFAWDVLRSPYSTPS